MEIQYIMLKQLFKHIFGTRNQRLIKQYSRQVERINALSESYSKLSDAELKAKTQEFRDRLAAGETVKDLLVEAFATVRETSWRVLQMRHFDVQLIGGMVLNDGKVAEMRTGEGKTLMSTLAVYLNALSGQGVHVVTVNDYLAERDANWMRPVYEFLGLTVGINPSDIDPELKQAAYAADITYGTNNEFGFDYLRDNMVYELEHKVQRPLHYAIVDEVDSILIDEARTPLIISGQTEDSSALYMQIDKLIPGLKLQTKKEEAADGGGLAGKLQAATAKAAAGADGAEEEGEIGDYTLDEKSRQVFLTESGHEHVEQILRDAGLLKPDTNLYAAANISLLHYFYAALRAHTLYKRDVDYIVKDNQVVIVDEHTGRLMEGRRWSEGLHQATEAKEGVPIQTENQTLASITFQNYFRLYQKLSGMTGTADTEAFELQNIYGLEVVVIPTNKPTVRADHADKIFINLKGKYKAITEDLKQHHAAGQPVLVGTASIASSEILSKILKQEKIKHEILNAKNHGREAKIIAQAGRPGAITIATNMAGRGTDIVLGGSFEEEVKSINEAASAEDKPELTADEVSALREAWEQRQQQVKAAGGLHVLGTERNESRRVDNQLRGRSGRQGDPGSSQFYLSLDDNLLRIFASERMSGLMRRLGVGEDDVIQHSMMSRSIEKAQRRVEGMNFDIRKQLLEYDDVANDQRKVVYQQRHKLLQQKDITEAITELQPQVAEYLVNMYMPEDSVVEQWDVASLEARLVADFNLKAGIKTLLAENEGIGPEDIEAHILKLIQAEYAHKLETADPAQMRLVERQVMLQILDQHWKDHLAEMDHLRQSIHLRGYAQKNPAQEYKRECFDMFTAMLNQIKCEVVAALTRMEVQPNPDAAARDIAMNAPVQNVVYSHQEVPNLAEQDLASQQQSDRAAAGGADSLDEREGRPATYVRQQVKVGRNDPCHCGSGKKYKHCHGAINKP